MANDFNPFKVAARSRRAKLIVDAARAIAAEAGPDAVGRQAVAKRAGLKPAEVTREFRDRAELMRAIAASD